MILFVEPAISVRMAVALGIQRPYILCRKEPLFASINTERPFLVNILDLPDLRPFRKQQLSFSSFPFFRIITPQGKAPFAKAAIWWKFASLGIQCNGSQSGRPFSLTVLLP